VTNIDREHMDCYRNMRDVKKDVSGVHGPGAVLWDVVVCNDDPMLRRLLPQAQRRTVTYGTKRGSDFLIKLGETGSSAGMGVGDSRPLSRLSGQLSAKKIWASLRCTCRECITF